MRELKPRFYIVSAERFGEIAYNPIRTANLEASLISFGLAYKRVEGCYQGTHEISFLVPDKGPEWRSWDGSDTFDVVKGLAEAFDQDTFFERHPDGAGEVHELGLNRFGKLASHFVGQWQEGTPRDGEAYTHDPESGVTYVCR